MGSRMTVPVTLSPEDRQRFRSWLVKLGARVDTALADPADMDAQADVRAMMLAAMKGLTDIEQREKSRARRRSAELNRAIRLVRARM